MSAGTHLEKDAARALAREALAGVQPERAFGLGCLKNIDRPLRAQMFCAAHPEGHVAVKVYAPAGAAKALAQATRQRDVAAAMSGGAWRAPEVLFFDEARLCLGMSYVPGRNLGELWPTLGGRAACAMLQRAGEWLAAHHAPTRRAGTFQPRGQLSWLLQLLQQRATGKRVFPEPNAFRTAVAAMEVMSSRVRERPTIHAVTHRDLHLSNLIDTGDGLCGLDFENDREDEPYRDLLTLLVDAAARHAGNTSLPALAQALAQGYGDSRTDPEVRLFLQRLFALGIWAATPAEPSVRQAARYAAAREIVALRDPLLI